VTRRLRRGATLVWALPALALVALFVYYPIVENVRLSFYHWNTFSPAQRFVGLDNYREAIHDPVFWHALRNNVAYAVVSVVVQVGFGLVLAALVEEFVLRRLRRIVQAILMIPSLLSVTVAGLLFQFVYDPKIGLIDTGLRAVGLDGLAHAWLGEPATAIW
jgi:raffinose/stachyose/melibiose transport system permease protein